MTPTLQAMTQQQFVSLVNKRRQVCGYTHEDFAEKVGISKQLWWYLRTDQRPVSVNVLRGVLQLFPDMDADVIAFLGANKHDHYKSPQERIREWIRQRRGGSAG